MTRELQFLRKMGMAGIGVSLILFVAFFSAYRSSTKSRELAGWVEHTQEVIGLIASVRLERARLQSELWNYFATRDANIPKTFQEDLRESQEGLDRLQRLTADNPAQQEILNGILPGLNARAEALVQAMKELATVKAIPGAAVDVASGVYSPGKLRELFDGLDASEGRLLATRTAAVAANARQTRIILVIAGGLTFVVLGLAAGFIRREILMRAEIERGLQAARELLGTKYEQQSGELQQTMSDLHSEIRARQTAEDEIRRANGELENRVTERTEELRKINKDLEAFTYSVSHDLRAPLRHMTGFSKILQAEYGGSLPTVARHYLNRVGDAATHMMALVEGLLSLSRIGRQELQKKNVSLSDLVGEAQTQLGDEGGAAVIEWKLGELPEVEGDPVLLSVVLTNLLSNAVKFTSHEAKAVIEVGSRDEGEETVVYVRDNGAGFDARYADKLFGIFQRLHRQDEFPGTGIGLATVQRIVHRHNGRVWADSQVGRGASFYFSLPRVKNKEEEIPVAIGATA